MKVKIQRLALPVIVCLTAINAHAEVVFGPGAVIREPGVSFDEPNATFPGDYTVPEGARVQLFHGFVGFGLDFSNNASLEVNGGSTLVAGNFLSTATNDPTLTYKSNILVKDAGSVRIGSDIGRTGNIVLNGFGDFDIMGGGVVNWIEPNNCNGDFLVCDILIGRSPASNTGIRVIGAGSQLDNFNTGGRLWVGADPKPNGWTQNEPVEDTTDFLVAQDGGLIRSFGASVGKGFEVPVDPLPGQPTSWSPDVVGYVRGTAVVDNGTWLSQSLNIGEGDGGSGNVFVVGGGIIDITTDEPEAGGFYLGQTADGVPTEGGSNLMVVDGPGSTVIADSNSGVLAASRIANGFVTVQNDGAIQLDSSVLLVSGKTGATLSDFNKGIAASDDVNITLDPSNINLDVLSGGSVSITDLDNLSENIGALIIGQTPLGLPTESASVRVSGVGSSITVSNDSNATKIPLSASEFGIPFVSNIGTGSLTIDAGGAVTFNNGDFVIAARASDDAVVSVTDSTLTADRVIVGWADYEAGVVSVDASTGVLTLNNGTVEGDVIVDDNGTLNGIGTINGTLFGHGGVISIGLSPGTITVESLTLGAGTELVMEVALNPDGSINPAASDSIVATSGSLDLSAGEVTFELSPVDPSTSLDEILGTAEVLSVEELFESNEEVVLASYNVTDPTGSLSDEDLDQRVEVLSFIKSACKEDGWEDLYRTDETIFDNQGDCIQYVNTGM